jgi:hypothetical protein
MLNMNESRDMPFDVMATYAQLGAVPVLQNAWPAVQ